MVVTNLKSKNFIVKLIYANIITVYLWTNQFKKIHPNDYTGFSRTIELPFATSNTNDLIAWSVAAVKSLYEKGLNYKKAGILASELKPPNQLQTNLFIPENKYIQSAELMKAVDEINKKMGRGAVYFVACGDKPGFKLKSEWRSKRFATRWEELLKVE